MRKAKVCCALRSWPVVNLIYRVEPQQKVTAGATLGSYMDVPRLARVRYSQRYSLGGRAMRPLSIGLLFLPSFLLTQLIIKLVVCRCWLYTVEDKSPVPPLYMFLIVLCAGVVGLLVATALMWVAPYGRQGKGKVCHAPRRVQECGVLISLT